MYLGVLVFILAFGAPGGGLVGVPIFFFLKNKLHMGATQISLYGLVAAIPAYLALCRGFARDLWNPFGLRDRGYMMIFGGLCAVGFVVFAFLPVTLASRSPSPSSSAACGCSLRAGQTGLGATIARQHVMSGQMSTVMNVFGSVAVHDPAGGRRLHQRLPRRSCRLMTRRVCCSSSAARSWAGLALFAVWRPEGGLRQRARRGTAPRSSPLKDIARLVRHYPIWPALAIWVLWNFAPGSGSRSTEPGTNCSSATGPSTRTTSPICAASCTGCTPSSGCTPSRKTKPTSACYSADAAAA